ncbi:MAG: hypothetical protein M1546_02860 [Chloroflexi bacterium]|nr:hypothetical protein [Chloroflexota bacterium]
MLIVADTSPLIVLAKLNRLDLLLAEFDRVVIPPAVYREGVIAGQQLRADDALVIQRAIAEGVIEVRAPQQVSSGMAAYLGQGELECIQLALELDADAVLMDDYNARRAAQGVFSQQNKRIEVRGTLGIVVGAVKADHLGVQEAIILVSVLRGRDDVWINPALCDQVIEALRKADKTL